MLASFAFLSIAAAAQTATPNVTTDAQGNFVAIPTPSVQSKPSGKKYTDTQGKQFEVYITGTGKLFVVKTSKKTGKEYKMYLTPKSN